MVRVGHRFLSLLGLGAASLSLFAGCPADAQTAAQALTPGRIRVDVREGPPWTGIGKLQAVAGSLRVTCTAAIIGRRTVLTAAHCLYNVRTQHNFLPSSMHFLAGFEGQKYAAAAIGEQFVVAPGYEPERPSATRGSDWAMVILDTEVGTRERILPINAELPRVGTPAMVGGYGQDNPNVLTADVACHVLGYTADEHGRRLIRHDCASTHGASGAPFLVQAAQGWSIGGVNVARSESYAVGFATVLEGVRWGP